MSVLQSHIDTNADWFEKNRDDMLEQLAIIDDLHDEAAAGGGAAAIERMRSRDKMPVRAPPRSSIGAGAVVVSLSSFQRRSPPSPSACAGTPGTSPWS